MITNRDANADENANENRNAFPAVKHKLRKGGYACKGDKSVKNVYASLASGDLIISSWGRHIFVGTVCTKQSNVLIARLVFSLSLLIFSLFI